MKPYRNEWKYCCEESDLKRLEWRLQAVMQLDSHTEASGRYQIHSLYFDDYKDSCAFETEAGLASRFKYRIRYYGDHPTSLRLERKEKLYGRGHKESCNLTPDQYQALIRGEIGALMWDTSEPLLRQLCIACLTRGFRPKVIIDYERTAYVEPNSNVRITADRFISASNKTEQFLTGDYMRHPLLPKDQHVLEVKFDDILPAYIKQAAFSSRLQQTSFSKYYLGYQCLRRFPSWTI
jgi:hypothetical protein